LTGRWAGLPDTKKAYPTSLCEVRPSTSGNDQGTVRQRRRRPQRRRGARESANRKAFVNVNPVTHLITAVRDLADKNVVGSDLGLALLGAAILVAIFAPLTVRLYMRKA
jgi:hypothetical protein